MDMSNTSFLYNGKTIKIFGYEEEYIFRSIKKRKIWYEKNLLEEISKITKNKKGIFVDAGANLGNHSIFFAKECNSTKVISFEPDEKIFNLLQKNIVQNKLKEKIEPIKIGLYSKKCFLKKIIDRSDNLGATEFVESNLKTDASAITLDSLSIVEPISCYKLDIQNLEMHAIIGSKETILRWKPIIVAEAMKNHQFVEINSFLEKMNYKIHPKNNKKKWWASSPTYIWIQK